MYSPLDDGCLAVPVQLVMQLGSVEGPTPTAIPHPHTRTLAALLSPLQLLSFLGDNPCLQYKLAPGCFVRSVAGAV